MLTGFLCSKQFVSRIFTLIVVVLCWCTLFSHFVIAITLCCLTHRLILLSDCNNKALVGSVVAIAEWSLWHGRVTLFPGNIEKVACLSIYPIPTQYAANLHLFYRHICTRYTATSRPNMEPNYAYSVNLHLICSIYIQHPDIQLMLLPGHTNSAAGSGVTDQSRRIRVHICNRQQSQQHNHGRGSMHI